MWYTVLSVATYNKKYKNTLHLSLLQNILTLIYNTHL